MRTVTERVTVRLSESLVDQMDAYMDRHDLESRSDVIRDALEAFLNRGLQGSGRGPATITVDLPAQTLKGLQQLVELGETVNIDEEVRQALKGYIDDRFDALERRADQMARLRRDR